MVLPFVKNEKKCPSTLKEFCQQVPRDGLANIDPRYLRPMVNLKPYMTAVEDQGNFNSW